MVRQYDVDVVHAVLTPMLGCLAVAALVGGVLMWRRRDTHPIKGRVVPLLLLCNLGELLYCLVLYVRDTTPSFPCWTSQLLNVALLSAIAGSYIIMMVVLLFRFELAVSILYEENAVEKLERAGSYPSITTRKDDDDEKAAGDGSPTTKQHSRQKSSVKIRPSGISTQCTRSSKVLATSSASPATGAQDRSSRTLTPPHPRTASAVERHRSNTSGTLTPVMVVSEDTVQNVIRRNNFISSSRADAITVEVSRTPGATPDVTPEKQQQQQQQTRDASPGSGAGAAGAEEDEATRLHHVWFLENRQLLTAKWLVCGYVLIVLVAVLLYVVLMSIVPDTEPAPGSTVCPFDIEGDTFFACLVVVFCITFIAIARRMREVVEGFFIKRDFVLVARSTLVGVVLWFLLNLSKHTSQYYFPLHHVVIFAAIAVHVYAGLWRPLAKSYFFERLQSDNSHHGPDASDYDVDIQFLEGVLLDREARKLFREHLAREFALENLTFWEESEDYVACCLQVQHLVASGEISVDKGTRLLKRKALKVYDMCISSNSPQEINIPHFIRTPIEAALKPFLHKHKSTPGKPKPRRYRRRSHRRRISIFNDSASPDAVGAGVLSKDNSKESQMTSSSESKNTQGGGRAREGSLAPSAGSTELLAEIAKRRESQTSPTAWVTFSDVFNHHLFAEAHANIVALMRTDNYSRFVRTQAYQELVMKREEAQVNRALADAFRQSSATPLAAEGVPGIVKSSWSSQQPLYERQRDDENDEKKEEEEEDEEKKTEH